MADHVGEQFGEYRLVRKLGGGAFGDVYFGEHIRDKAPVAIKVLLARLTHSEDLKDFINEVRTLFHLQHPNIIPLLDFGIERSIPFLVMTYAPNGTLRQPKGVQLPLDTIATYIRQVAEALQFAHDRKLIHRDVKPVNILLGSDSHIWLSDFGITTIAHSSRSLNTQDNSGTIEYMAPEQIQGKPRPASDQYALGVITYEWITGSRPFTGTLSEIAIQHMQTSPPSMQEKLPKLSPAIEQVVLRALEKDYEKRFANVREFAAAFSYAVEETKPVSQKTSKQMFEEGYAHLVAKRHIAAIELFDQAITLEPSPHLFCNRGNAYSAISQFEQAIEDYNRALDQNHLYVYAYSGRGFAYAHLKQYRQALEDFNTAIALKPGFAESYGGRGLTHFYLGNCDRAIESFNRAITLKPHAEAYSGRGLVYAYLKQYDRALEDYDLAIILDPQNAHTFNHRGIIYTKLKQYRRALEDYDRSITLDPQNAIAYYNRGNAYYSLEDYRQAADDFDQAFQLNLNSEWFRSLRDFSLRRLGKKKIWFFSVDINKCKRFKKIFSDYLKILALSNIRGRKRE